MTETTKYSADIDNLEDGWVQVTISGNDAHNLTEHDIERALSALHAKAGGSVIRSVEDARQNLQNVIANPSKPTEVELDAARSALSTKLQEPVGWLYEWPNGRKEFRSSDKPKDFDAWAATITPLYTSPTLAHQPVTAGLERDIREECAAIGYRVCAETRHVTLGDKVRLAILAALKSEGRK